MCQVATYHGEKLTGNISVEYSLVFFWHKRCLARFRKPCFERWSSAAFHWPLSFHRDVSPALSKSSLSIKIPRTIKLHLRGAAFRCVPTAYGCLSASKVSVPVDQPWCMIETCECWMTAENYTFISHRKKKVTFRKSVNRDKPLRDRHLHGWDIICFKK